MSCQKQSKLSYSRILVNYFILDGDQQENKNKDSCIVLENMSGLWESDRVELTCSIYFFLSHQSLYTGLPAPCSQTFLLPPSSANANAPVQNIPLYPSSHLSSLFLSLPCLSWHQCIGLFLSAIVLGVKNRFQAWYASPSLIFPLSSYFPSPASAICKCWLLFLMLAPLLKHFCPGQVHFGPHAHQSIPILFCKWIKASKRNFQFGP